MSKEPTVEWRNVDDLIPHPDQPLVFGNASEEEIKELAEDISRRGLTDLIEALSNGTIVAGHSRHAAMKLLGWTETQVIVRKDLDSDPKAAHEAFIQSNLQRRHLSPLQITKCHLELEKAKQLGSCQSDADHTDHMATLPTKLGGSEKTARRYIKIAAAPIEVQEAFERKEIIVVEAARVADLPSEVQEEIAAEIRAGRHSKLVLKDHLPKSATKPKAPAACLKELAAAIEEALGMPAIVSVDLPPYASHEKFSLLFKSGRELLARLERWNKLQIKRAAPRDEEMYQIIQRQARRSIGEVE